MNKVTDAYHVSSTFKNFFRGIVHGTCEVRSHLFWCFLWIYELMLQKRADNTKPLAYVYGQKQRAVLNSNIHTSLTTDRHNPICSELDPNLLATSHRPALLKVLYIDFRFGTAFALHRNVLKTKFSDPKTILVTHS